MSKHDNAKKKTETEDKTTAVAAAPSSALPAFLADKVAADAGKGVSTASEDNIVPLIYVLQANSPQAKRNHPDYIPGAMEGDIWLRNAPAPIVSGDKGITVQPCYFYRALVEWLPGRGGFVKQHNGQFDPKALGAEEKPHPENPKKMQWVLPSGNILVDTRYHVVRVFLEDGSRAAYVIPMSSTGHTASRTWMTLMNNKRVQGGIAPSYACLYTLKTKNRTKGEYSWSMWDIADAGWIQSEEDFTAGAALFAAFETGAKQAEQDHSPDAAAPAEGDTM